MKKLLKFVSILVFMTVSFSISAQVKENKETKKQPKIKKAGKSKTERIGYDELAFVESSKILDYAAKKGYSGVELFQKLANSYYFNNKMEEASKYYAELFKLKDSTEVLIEDEYLFRYAMALKGIEDYKKADSLMMIYAKLHPNEVRVNAFIAAPDYLQTIKNTTQDIQLKSLAFNSPFSDFGTSFYNNQLVFASSAKNSKRYNWNNQGYLNLYTATPSSNGDFSDKEELSKAINSKFHESSAVFLNNNEVMFFTRNNYFEGDFTRDEKGFNRLQLYRITKNDKGEWDKDNMKPVHFNSREYSVAHPTITKDGKYMYFSSDMPGTLGDSDIWVVKINKDYTLGTPKNLGKSINTEAKETFPFINEKGDLYFSTTGQPGLGGLDIYSSKTLHDLFLKGNTTFIVSNLGLPFNSSSDDFAYFENTNIKFGFISSNRKGGKGDDDIYSFKIPDCEQLIEGVVKNIANRNVISGADVKITTLDGKSVDNFTTDVNGKFSYTTKCSVSKFIVSADKEDYKNNSITFETKKNGEAVALQVPLTPIPKKKPVAEEGTDLFILLNLKPIYFAYDMSDILPESELELKKVIAYLNEYPSVKIDVRSHTDSRGRDAYNLALSQRRNKSTIEYIINNSNILKSRITGKGYGETRLLNRCTNGVKCSKQEHQQNRRSEFVVTEN